jgi:hypothetical protein
LTAGGTQWLAGGASPKIGDGGTADESRAGRRSGIEETGRDGGRRNRFGGGAVGMRPHGTKRDEKIQNKP